MRVYKLYASVIDLSLTFLEKVKSDIIDELNQISETNEPIDCSIIPNLLKNELTFFLNKIDSPDKAKLIEKINQTTVQSSSNSTLSAACLALVGIAAYKFFETKNLSFEIFALLSVAACVWIYQTKPHQDNNHQKTVTEAEPNRVRLCPLGFS